jgi:hypothetical protein
MNTIITGRSQGCTIYPQSKLKVATKITDRSNYIMVTEWPSYLQRTHFGDRFYKVVDNEKIELLLITKSY